MRFVTEIFAVESFRKLWLYCSQCSVFAVEHFWFFRPGIHDKWYHVIHDAWYMTLGTWCTKQTPRVSAMPTRVTSSHLMSHVMFLATVASLCLLR